MKATLSLPPTLQTILELCKGVRVQSAHCSAVGLAAFLLMLQHCTKVGHV